MKIESRVSLNSYNVFSPTTQQCPTVTSFLVTCFASGIRVTRVRVIDEHGKKTINVSSSSVAVKGFGTCCD